MTVKQAPVTAACVSARYVGKAAGPIPHRLLSAPRSPGESHTLS